MVWLLTGEGEMLKESREQELLDFDQLPKERQQQIERIIEMKIRERQDAELQRLLKEVTTEIERTQQNLRKKS